MKPQIKITPFEWDTIETYLDTQNISEADLPVDENLSNIPDLNAKIRHILQVRSEIADAIKQSKIKEFHQHITDSEHKLEKKIAFPRKKTILPLILSIAAILILLFGIFWMMDLQEEPAQLFAKNFKPDIGLPLKMSTSNANGFYEGMLEYKQENYAEAISIWEKLLAYDPQNDTLNYFLGVAYLALGKADKSLEYLHDPQLFLNGMFSEDAAYYAALAEIKKGDFQKAIKYLKNKPSSRNKKLLDQLHGR